MTEISRRALCGGALAGAAAWAGCAQKEGKTKLWFSYGGKNRETLLRLVAAWNLKAPEAAIEAVFQGDYFELLAKLRTSMFAGEAPAVTHVIAEVIPYLVEADVLLPLGELDGFEEPSDLVRELAQVGTFSGPARTTVAVPWNRSTPIAYLNLDRFEEAGASAPTTWSELEEVAARLTGENANGERQYGFACPVDWWFWVALVGQAGGAITGPDGQFTLGGEHGVSALQFWKRLVHERRSMKPPQGRDYTSWQNINQDFLSGRAAMVWNSSAFLKYIEQNAKFRVGTVALPAGVRRAVPSGGTMFVVPKTIHPRDRSAVARFLNYMSSPEVSNDFATSTGYIPTTERGIQALTDRGHFKAFPNEETALDQRRAIVPWPWHRDLFRIQRDVIQGKLEACVLGDEDAETTLREAAAQIARGLL